MSYTIQQDGTAKALTAATATASTTLPTNGTGSIARRCRVTAESAAAGLGATVLLGNVGVTVTVATGVHIPQGRSVILFTRGHAELAAIRTGGTDVEIHIVPLSD